MRSNFISIALLALLVGCQSTRTDPETEALLGKLQGEGDLIVAKSSGEIPNDPFAPVWQTATESRIPLGSQSSVAPRTPVMKRAGLGG